MAAKKTTDTEAVTKPVATSAVIPKSYVTEDDTKRYKIKLPVDKKEGDKRVIVNDRVYTIKRGKDVFIPEWVYEALKHQEDMELLEYEYQESIKNKLAKF